MDFFRKAGKYLIVFMIGGAYALSAYAVVDTSDIEKSSSNFLDRFENNKAMKEDLKTFIPSQEKLDAYKEYTSGMLKDAKMVVNESLGNVNPNKEYDSLKGYETETLFVFYSFSMGEKESDSLFEALDGTGARVVLKGMGKGDEKLQDTMAKLAKMIKDHKGFSISINPRVFDKFNVNLAPTMVYQNRDDKNPHTVIGTVSPDWFVRTAKKNYGTHNLGVKGKTFEIEERDFTEEMKERASKVDWAEKQKNAKNNFWKKTDLLDMDYALKNDSRIVDLTMVATKDVSIEGSRVFQKGEVINPFIERPMTTTLVIFDGTNANQIVWAKEYAKTIKTPRVTFITTKIEREFGWKHLDKLYKYFGRKVTILQKDMKQKFSIRALPSAAYEDKSINMLKVDEFLVKELDLDYDEIKYVKEEILTDKKTESSIKNDYEMGYIK